MVASCDSTGPGWRTGARTFAVYSLLLGLSLGYYSWQTESIRWATIVHVVDAALALPGFAWLGILAAQFP